MPISEMNDFIEKISLTELFEMLGVDRYRKLHDYRKYLTEIELADLRLTRDNVGLRYLNREGFDGESYVPELARLLIYIVKTCQLAGITAKEFHRHHLNLMLSRIDQYPDNIREAAEIYDNDSSIEPKMMWYFSVLADTSVIESTVDSIAAVALTATLSSLIDLITAGGDSALYFIELLKYLGISCCVCDVKVNLVLREVVSIINGQKEVIL